MMNVIRALFPPDTVGFGDILILAPIAILSVLVLAHWARNLEHRPLSPWKVDRLRRSLESKEWRR